MKKNNDFRVHHILCTTLYQGKGYSGAFCENMTKIVESLRENPEQKLRLVTSPDMICQNCPNKTADNGCAQDCTKNKKSVAKKDEALLEVLHLEKSSIQNEEFSYRELLEFAKKYITKEEFNKSCKNCTWFLQGLCSAEQFEKRLGELLR